MSVEELLKEIYFLKEENEKIKLELQETKEHLKKYTAPVRCKTFYENHKEEIKLKVKEYKEKTNYDKNISKDKKSEYNKKAYQKKKEKNIHSENI
jgi:hypothetical protein